MEMGLQFERSSVRLRNGTAACLACLVAAHVSLAACAATGTVRVAAIQCSSVMGEITANTSNMTALIRQAAAQGAKIVVTPECAVQGYMDPTTWTSWAKAAGEGPQVSKVAEPIPGPTTKLMGRLAADLGIYLCVGMIEAGTNGFYNAQVLLSPAGSIIAHHRKRALWTPGDSTWCTKGDLPVQVVGTEYGNLGLMICFDFHVLPPRLAERKADIVLYSVGWYGPNEKTWFGKTFPAQSVVPYGYHLIAANWTSPTAEDGWPGRGYSCIIRRDGHVLSMTERVYGNAIVMADLPLSRNQTP